jgi:L-arabinose transport system permease protein
MQTPSTDSPTPAVASAGLSARAARTWDLINKSGIVMVFIILFAVLSFTVPDFLSSRNIQGLLLSVTLIGSISVTMMFVLALGEVDLSVASIVAFAGVAASTVITATHSVLLGVAVSAAARSSASRFRSGATSSASCCSASC